VPHLSGLAASKQSLLKRGVLQSVRLFLAGLHDRARDLVGMPPAYLTVAGLPGSNSFMELGFDELHQYFAKHPEQYMVRQGAAPHAIPCDVCGSLGPVHAFCLCEAHHEVLDVA
jgi:hypothetical protein